MFVLLTMKVQPTSMSRDVFWGLCVEEREKPSLEEQGSVRGKNLFRREPFQTREDKQAWLSSVEQEFEPKK